MSEIELKIVREINYALSLLGAKSDLLGTVGSWKDCLPDEDVLAGIKAWNEWKRTELSERLSLGSADNSTFVSSLKQFIMGKTLQKEYEFKYQGQSHLIDMNTLLASQFHFSAIVNEAKSKVHPEVNLKVKVKAFEKGSFDINQFYEITAVTGIFVLENIDYVTNILSVVADYISVKQFLKSEKAVKEVVKGNKVEISIEGNNNTLIIGADAFKIYKNNVIINEAISQAGKILSADDEIDGIEITDRKTGEKVVSVPREKFEDLSARNPYLDEDEKESVKQATIGILKWETIPKKGSKWSFIYENRKINSVSIRDEEFLRSILDNKTRFGAGDCLYVDLLIRLKRDEVSGMYLEDGFEILKVHNVIWRGEQGSLF